MNPKPSSGEKLDGDDPPPTPVVPRIVNPSNQLGEKFADPDPAPVVSQVSSPPIELGDKFSDDAAGVTRSLREHPWVRTLVLIGICVLGLATAVGIALFNDWHKTRLTELARQRTYLQRFLHSPEFEQFTQIFDRQLVALNNYICARPQETRALIPAVAAREKGRRELAWTVQVLPLPISAGAEPARVANALHEINVLLAQRGFVVDERARMAARTVFLRSMSPFAGAFLKRENSAGFPALALDRTMQDDALAAYAAHYGTGITMVETERIFALYAAIGPSMWRAIEAEAKAEGKPAAAAR